MSELNECSSSQLLEKLNSGELSILRVLGAKRMKNEMIPPGLFCRALTNLVCLAKDDAKIKKRALKLLKILTPLKTCSEFPKSDEAIVIGFNHPSLGEIFRLLIIAFESYPDREYLFPVNLPWYEAMTCIIPKIEKLGIHITPMVTPSTAAKLNALFSDDEEKLAQVQHIKNRFERRYMKLAGDCAEAGNIIFVAPSSTRQEKVIGDHIHPTMTILAHMVCKKPDTKVQFIPTAVIKPKNGNRGINLFKTYMLSPCEPFKRPEVEALTNKSREFDLIFLQRIDSKYGEIGGKI